MSSRSSRKSKFEFPRKRVLVDFDGTVGEFNYPGLPKRPYPGFLRAMRLLKRRGFEVKIFTTRAWPGWAKIHGRRTYKKLLGEVHAWLERWKVPHDGVTHEKLPAMYIVDDRALNPKVVGWKSVVSVIVKSVGRDPYGRVGILDDESTRR